MKKRTKLTNKQLARAWSIVEQAAAYGELESFQVAPKLQAFFSLIYRIAHAVNAPDCMKNHPEWDSPIRQSK